MSDSLWAIDTESKEGSKEGVAGAINGNAPTQQAWCARSIDGAIFGGRRYWGASQMEVEVTTKRNPMSSNTVKSHSFDSLDRVSAQLWTTFLLTLTRSETPRGVEARDGVSLTAAARRPRLLAPQIRRNGIGRERER